MSDIYGRLPNPGHLLDVLPAMSGSEAKVALAIYARWRSPAEKCWPGFDQIKIDTRLSRSAITRAVKRWEGVLWTVQRKAGRGHAVIIKSIRKGSTSDTLPDVKRCQGSDLLGDKRCQGDTIKGSTRATPKETREKQGARKRRSAAPTPTIPGELDTPDFRRVWADWTQHRREIRKTLTPTTASRQLTKLADMGVVRAVAAIEHTIAQGWQGIYEPSAGGIGRAGAGRAAPPRRRRDPEPDETPLPTSVPSRPPPGLLEAALARQAERAGEVRP